MATPEELGRLVDRAAALLAASEPRMERFRREECRRAIATGVLTQLRAEGRLLEQPPVPHRLPALPDRDPDVGQWARQRERCERGHRRHGPYDRAGGLWHLVKRCRWTGRRRCCPVRGACGAPLRDHRRADGHLDYLEVADGAPPEACQRCVALLERRQRATEQLRELLARDAAD